MRTVILQSLFDGSHSIIWEGVWNSTVHVPVTAQTAPGSEWTPYDGHEAKS